MKTDDFKKVWLSKTPDGLMLETLPPDTKIWRVYGEHYIHIEAANERNNALPMESEECRVVPLVVLKEMLEKAWRYEGLCK